MPASVAAVVASKQAEEEQQTEVKTRAPALPSEDEPDYDPTLCTLDWYSSDLNLSIVPTDFCSAIAMSQRGFGYMWAGARATQVDILGRNKFTKVQLNEFVLIRGQRKGEFATRCELIGTSRRLIWARRPPLMSSDVAGNLFSCLFLFYFFGW